MRIVLGSTSTMKQAACRAVFERYLTGKAVVVPCPVSSGVPPTPHQEETLAGARTRARACRAQETGDFYVGLESGLIERYGQVYEEAWSWVLLSDGREFAGYSSGLRVPEYVLARMRRENLPHFEVMHLIEVAHGLPSDDTWANYSGGLLARQVSLEEALRNALVQLVPQRRSLYQFPEPAPNDGSGPADSGRGH